MRILQTSGRRRKYHSPETVVHALGVDGYLCSTSWIDPSGEPGSNDPDGGGNKKGDQEDLGEGSAKLKNLVDIDAFDFMVDYGSDESGLQVNF